MDLPFGRMREVAGRGRGGGGLLFVSLWELRATFGVHLAALAYRYGIDVEPDLAFILVPGCRRWS